MIHDLTHDEVQKIRKTARALLDQGKKLEAVRNHFSLLDENHNPRFSADSEALHVLLAQRPSEILPNAPVSRIVPTAILLVVPAGEALPAPKFLQDISTGEASTADSRASTVQTELLTALARIDRGIACPPATKVQSATVPITARFKFIPPRLPYPLAGLAGDGFWPPPPSRMRFPPSPLIRNRETLQIRKTIRKHTIKYEKNIRKPKYEKHFEVNTKRKYEKIHRIRKKVIRIFRIRNHTKTITIMFTKLQYENFSRSYENTIRKHIRKSTKKFQSI